MSRFDTFLQRLKNKAVILLDGAMGTEIQRRGVRTDLPLWSAGVIETRPDVIKQIHLDYIQAGSDIITTNTFRTNRRTFNQVDRPEAAVDLAHQACQLAIEARELSGNDNIIIAGSVAPLEDCYRPDLVPPDNELFTEHEEWIGSLVAGKADFIFIETMNCIREGDIALQCAKQCDIPVAISFVCNEQGDLLSGESLSKALEAWLPYEPFAVLANCRSCFKTDTAIEKLLELSPIPIGAYPNGIGEPHDEQGWIFPENTTEAREFFMHISDWLSKGVQIVGGCCGTTPEDIQTINNLLSKYNKGI